MNAHSAFRCGHQFHQRRRGCSLIELLVVITILIIVASMTAPIYSGVKTRAARTDCTTRTRSVADAGLLFYLDHDDRYPGEAPGTDCAYEPYTIGVLAPYLGGQAGIGRLRGCPYSWMGGNLTYSVTFTRIDRSWSGYRLYGRKAFSVSDSHHWYRKDPVQFGFVDDQWGTAHYYHIP